MKRLFFLLFAAVLAATTLPAVAQIQFPWPVTPFHESHEITGTFCEFRNTGSADHFHNGTDIPKADGSPVYPVKDGVVTSIGAVSSSGSNAYVRVEDIAYVHIVPNPSLAVGDSVFALQTVLGTIYPGLGHVHFTNGYIGQEKNSMLPNSGLTPLTDKWAPIIRYIRFYVNGSQTQFTTNRVSGAVDIVVKVDEQNGPPSSPVSRRNNGTYKIGYRIFAADTQTVVYEPPSGGLRFRFDTKPRNAYVHNVYFDRLSSTTSHVYIVTNAIKRDSYWNTADLDTGRYVVQVFTADTRGNADTAYAAVYVSGSDVLPPRAPTLRFVGDPQGILKLAWYPNTEPDLLGYRAYFSSDAENWSLALGEAALSREVSDTSFALRLGQPRYFTMTAVDDAFPTNESGRSDVYGTRFAPPGQRILIVDGFDRTENSGSWHKPSHNFAFIHGQAIAAAGFGFDTVPNEALLDGTAVLNDYDAVVWILGDESTHDETFSAEEQALVKNYLEAGGNLFVSGSEIAWDLDQDNPSSGSTAADEAFLHSYLKADYVKDDAGIYTVEGLPGSVFDGISFTYGTQPYPEDYPDAIRPVAGGVACLRYSGSSLIAGVQYAGSFGQGTVPGKLVYLAFPFETITGQSARETVMSRILHFFFPSTEVALGGEESLPRQFRLLPNYPNPFNPSTTIRYVLPARCDVLIRVTDVLGRQVAERRFPAQEPGLHSFEWSPEGGSLGILASGVYFLQIHAEDRAHHREYSATGKMIFVK